MPWECSDTWRPMPTEITLSMGMLYGFLLVLVRVGGALIFVPLPGVRGSPGVARAALAVGFTLALFPRWPTVEAPVSPAALLGWMFAEAAVGIAIGLAVAVVLEAFTFASQILGLQAGYAYASTIDPNTDADSGVLLVFSQLLGGLLFFALGLHREVLRLFAESLSQIPLGGYRPHFLQAQAAIQLGGSLLTIGMRMAFPVVALLVLVDVALALVGRLQAQLQLLALAFPAKMLAALVMCSAAAALFPRLSAQLAQQAWIAMHRTLGI
jgi:flagellar biosynthetic protein FliR